MPTPTPTHTRTSTLQSAWTCRLRLDLCKRSALQCSLLLPSHSHLLHLLRLHMLIHVASLAALLHSSPPLICSRRLLLCLLSAHNAALLQSSRSLVITVSFLQLYGVHCTHYFYERVTLYAKYIYCDVYIYIYICMCVSSISWCANSV